MSDVLWGVLLGGAISSLTAWLVGWQSARSAATRQKEQLAHERAERRFDGAVHAYVDFAARMRASETAAASFESRHGISYADDLQGPDGDPRPAYDRETEDALDRMRLLVPEALYSAGRHYLDAHYWCWYYVPDAPDHPTSVDVAASAFIRVARTELHLDGAS